MSSYEEQMEDPLLRKGGDSEYVDEDNSSAVRPLIGGKLPIIRMSMVIFVLFR